MKKIRILALNDDNHETSFHSEWDQKPFHTHMDFIKMLAKPHDWEYEVRCVYLLDIDMNDEKSCQAFDTVQIGTGQPLLNYLLAFEHLWEISKETMFGGC